MTNAKPIIWSPQQQAFLAFCRDPNGGSCILVACAGTGKTTVLIEGGQVIDGGVAYMAYNRDIADETKGKLAALNISWKKMQANTAHGYGNAAWRKKRPGMRVEENKVRDIVDRLLTNGHPLVSYGAEIVKLVSLAKQAAIGIVGAPNTPHTWLEMAEHFDVFDNDNGNRAPQDRIIALAMDVLERSTGMLDEIDFDDMIYLPLYHKARFWQHDVIMVDEAQDTNAARRALIRAMLKKGGRVIAVGDPAQAIYGFTGADADSLDLIAADFNCRRLPLTVSYRCPQTVVNFARQWVSHIEAAPTAPEGSVSAATMEQFLARNDLNGSAAVLCRLNKPLVTLAFSLIRKRIPCKIQGRDIGKRIVKLITRWKVRSLDALESRLQEYLARETTKLLAKKQETKLAEVEDAVETVKVIIDQCQLEQKNTIEDAVAYVESLFSDKITGMLTLCSIHKSKGREWERVFWLDRAGTCPSKWARQEWQQGQEKNLMYVAATRAKSDLIELAPGAPKKAA